MNTSIAPRKITKREMPSQMKQSNSTSETTRRILLACGIMSSVLYLIVNVVAVILYEGYDAASLTVSELSAIGAPTRQLWVALMVPYSLLMIAFGFGVWQSAAGSRPLRIVAVLFIANAIPGFFWPPMHQREVLAAGGGTLTDTLHIVFTMATVPLMMFAIGFGAAALGKRFRMYSIGTLVILVIAGIFTGIDAPKIEANLPTTFIGIWERINIGVYMLWVAVLATVLLRTQKGKSVIRGKR